MSSASAPDRHSVRQQLDELDALLQRMLSLPLHGEGPSAPRPAPAEQPPPAMLKDAWKAPAMTLLPASDPVPPPTMPEAPRWDPNWSINLNPQQGSSILGDRSPAASVYRPPIAGTIPPVARSGPVGYTMPEPPPPSPEPPPVLAFPDPPYHPLADARPAPLPVIAWPLVALDGIFDAVVGLFPFGSLLSTRLGKNIVGLLGIAMILAGAAWGVLDFLGWSRR